MTITVNKRCVLIVILAMVFLLALLNGILQSKQASQEISKAETTIIHPLIESPKSDLSQKAKNLHSQLYINHASVAEIASRLKGVGEKIAQRIVRKREEHGDFKGLEDLKLVSGMGFARIQENKEIINFDSLKQKK